MNKFLDKLWVERKDDWRESPISFKLEEYKSNEVNLDYHSYQNKFSIVGKVVVDFWANQAQYDHAYDQAMRFLCYHLYGDAIAQLENIRYLVNQGYREDANEAISKLITDFKPNF